MRPHLIGPQTRVFGQNLSLYYCKWCGTEANVNRRSRVVRRILAEAGRGTAERFQYGRSVVRRLRAVTDCCRLRLGGLQLAIENRKGLLGHPSGEMRARRW